MQTKNLSVSFEKARTTILDSVIPLNSETISMMDASQRILFEDIISDIQIPGVDDSAMDGYAIISADIQGASTDHPARLRVIGEVQAGGTVAGLDVSRGTAVRIMTGAPIPSGADSVIKFEDTEEDDDFVSIFHKASQYNNYRFAGENIDIGDNLLKKGDRLKSSDIGLLASLNRERISVYRQPTVSIISTGDEIAEVGEPIGSGQIRNVNAYTLYSEVKKYSCHPHYLGIARDSMTALKELFIKALKSDVIITTGGVSMGKYDYVRDIYADLDIDIQFERIDVKPGSPCSFGKKGNQLIFGLPGNPVPTLTSFIEFVRPALLKLMGATRIKKPIVNAILEEDIRSAEIHHLMRGFFTIKNNEIHVSPTANQKPSMLRSMSAANCLIILPENVLRAKAGEKVAIELIDHDEI